jgi:hypothetical protein
MKKIMMIAAMMVAAVTANAQNEVGQLTLKPTVGMNIASMTKTEGDSKVRVGIAAGVEAEYGITESFSLSAGLLYSMQGVKGNGSFDLDFFDEYFNYVGDAEYTGKATVKLDYINIPILANYYVIPGLAIKAGIQPAFNVSKKVKFEGDVIISGNKKETVNVDKKIDDGVKAFQFAIPVGISYEYKNFVLDARYNIGVTKAFKYTDSRHSVFQITLGYKFAL